MPDGRSPITVVGVLGDRLADSGADALESCDLVVGGRRQLARFAPHGVRKVAISGDVTAVAEEVAAEPGKVCVLASGDPGFFGIVRALAERFGPQALEVHPAPSSVSLAFARLGLPWDDAVVVSAHGRPLADAVRRVVAASKAAVLASPDSPPEAIGRCLVELGVTERRVAVCARLGTGDERVDEVNLAGLAAGTWDPLAVVVLLDGPEVAPQPALSWGLRETGLAWGLSEDLFAHRDGMVTKAEVRAIALGKLGLPAAGVLWDVGAGSGSVAVECARLVPGLQVVAVERRADDAARIGANAAAAGCNVEVVVGSAPAALDGLPSPDRAFVGGGGIAVLDAVLARLRPGGRVVAAYAAMDRAAAAFAKLGHLVEIGVSRAGALPDGGVRLAAENPVFLAWGPGDDVPPWSPVTREEATP